MTALTSANVLRGHHVEPRLPRHPRGRGRRAGADGLGVPAARHQHQTRLGFLLALTGLMGWMTIMGLVWSMYGIGKQGPAATWKVQDLNYDDLTQTEVVVARELGPRPARPRSRSSRPTRSWPSSSRRPKASSARASATCWASTPSSRSS